MKTEVERVGGPNGLRRYVLRSVARKLAHGQTNVEFRTLDPADKVRTMGSRSTELFNSMESLILAQDERWRRA